MIRQAGRHLSLVDVARIALAQVGAGVEVANLPIADAVERFLREKRTDSELRPKTVSFYEEQLGLFVDDCPWRQLSEIDSPGFARYIKALPYPSTGSKDARARAVRALCGYGVKQKPKWITEVPASWRSNNKGGKGGKTNPFLPNDVVRSLLRNLPDHYVPAAALALFSGVRPEELRGEDKPALDWKQIDMQAKSIRVNAEQAKVGRPRLIEGLPETVWTWLESIPADKRLGPVQPVAAPTFAARVKKVVREAGGTYVQDILRHTYATNHLALRRNPGEVAMALGHCSDPHLLHKVYAGLTSQRDAETYFAIGPSCRIPEIN
jgi:integrase